MYPRNNKTHNPLDSFLAAIVRLSFNFFDVRQGWVSRKNKFPVGEVRFR